MIPWYKKQRFRYYRGDGKLVDKPIPIRNQRLPKKKRLRKKKFWFNCGKCTDWLKRYEQPSTATTKDGKRVCYNCLTQLINNK